MADATNLRLGFLEKEVLEWLWSRDWSDVREAHAALGEARSLSPNTLHSTLERLVRKSLVERTRRGRAYVYRARVSREDFVRAFLGRTLAEMPGLDANVLLASFVDLAERVDAAGLADLERLVRERRNLRKRGALGEDES